jgi:hypothetical protein
LAAGTSSIAGVSLRIGLVARRETELVNSALKVKIKSLKQVEMMKLPIATVSGKGQNLRNILHHLTFWDKKRAI